MDDERITKLKLQAFSLAALEMILGYIVEKVSSMMENEHPDRYIIRVYLRREFRSLRLDSHTICDSKHSFVNEMTKDTLFYGIYGKNRKIPT